MSPEAFTNVRHEVVNFINEKNYARLLKDFKTLHAPGVNLLECLDVLPFLRETRVLATLKINEKSFYQLTLLNRTVTVGAELKKYLDDYAQGGSPTHSNPI